MKRAGSHIVTAVLSVILTLAVMFHLPSTLQQKLFLHENSQRVAADIAPRETAVAKTASTADQNRTIEELKEENAWLRSVLDQLDQTDNTKPNPHQPASKKPSGNTGVWFDDAALVKAGLDPRDFDDLKDQYEALTLKELQLSNRARREGWLGKPKFFKKIRTMQQNFRKSLTPEDYDRVLYATNQTNRVEVTDVLAQSAASAAGIQPGDIILSYDGTHIFKPSDLFEGTTQGTAGEMVPIKLQRGDNTFTTYIPRGALGTRFKVTRKIPN